MAPVGQYLRYSTVFDEQANLRVLALAAALARTKPDGRARDLSRATARSTSSGTTRSCPTSARTRGSTTRSRPRRRRCATRPRSPCRCATAASTPTTSPRPPGSSPDEIAQRHAAVEYRVCARATVGQPMMGVTDERLRVPAPAEPENGRSRARGGDRQRAGDDLPRADAGRLERDRHRAGQRLRPAPRRAVRVRARRPRALRAARRRAARAAAASARCCRRSRGIPPSASRSRARSTCCSTAAASTSPTTAWPSPARSTPAPRAWPTRWPATRPGTTLIESTLNGPTLLALRDVVVGAAGRGLQLHVDERAGRPDDDARPQGPAGRPAADRRGRARLPRARGRDRRRAVPGLDQRRPDRADRQPAQARRRARPRPRRRRPARDAGAARRRSRSTSCIRAPPRPAVVARRPRTR